MARVPPASAISPRLPRKNMEIIERQYSRRPARIMGRAIWAVDLTSLNAEQRWVWGSSPWVWSFGVNGVWMSRSSMSSLTERRHGGHLSFGLHGHRRGEVLWHILPFLLPFSVRETEVWWSGEGGGGREGEVVLGNSRQGGGSGRPFIGCNLEVRVYYRENFCLNLCHIYFYIMLLTVECSYMCKEDRFFFRENLKKKKGKKREKYRINIIWYNKIHRIYY